MLWYSKVNRPCIVAQLCVLVNEARSAAMQRGQANMYTELCCCAARAYAETLNVLWHSKVNWAFIAAQLCVLVNEARSAAMQRGQANMYTKLCCCAARAYAKPLNVLWLSKVN